MLERMRTALVAGLLFFAIVLYAPHAWVALFFFMLAAAAAWESARMLHLNARGAAVVLLLLALGCLGCLYSPLWAQLAVGAALLLWCTVLPWALHRYQRQEALPWDNALILLLNYVQLLGFFAAAQLLHQRLGAGILWLFVLIWCSDSGAYFVGRAWGKTPLASRLSPKKTLEGLLGGLLLALLLAAGLYAGEALLLPRAWLPYLLLVSLALLMGVLGDLWESLLKRRAGIKDSGRLLPGHGGVYDRIDSWVAALPFFVGLIP